ncbi:Acyl-coenzyme A thioesterase 13 [Blyttiomyces sp. JEL0837]|nr:Acyl-coenzyme A thioesterase 13 [Blyttiomyces sp. JEL0837]
MPPTDELSDLDKKKLLLATPFKSLKAKEEKLAFVGAAADIFADHSESEEEGPRFDTGILKSIKPVDAEVGKVTWEMTVARKFTNGRGFMHGGAIASVIDNLSSLAILTHSIDGFSGVSVSLSTDYCSAAPENAVLKIVSEVTQHGRQLVYTHTRIYLKETGRLVAMGSHTKYVSRSMKDGDEKMIEEERKKMAARGGSKL